MKKSTLMILLAASIWLLASCGNQATASTMQLVKTEGAVNISDSSGKEISLFENMKLYSGYNIFTKKSSYAWIDLDSTKLAKMDVESEVEVQKKKKSLEIIVNSGKLYFNIAERLSDDETLNIKSSTLYVGIRGTCGWVEVEDPEHMKVYILEGTVQCTAVDADSGKSQTINVSGGEVAEMELYPDAQKAYSISKSKFTEQEIADFVWTEIVQDEELCQKIQEESGLDVLGLGEEEKPTPTPDPEPTNMSIQNPTLTEEAPSSTDEAEEDYIIEWKDAELERLIREYLGKETGDVYYSDVERIEEIRIYAEMILKESEMVYSTSLNSFQLNNNQEGRKTGKILTLEDLGHFTGLKALEVGYQADLSDISALKDLTNLESLALVNNQISDISALTGPTNLVSLSLGYNQINNINALKDLTNLETLALWNNQISDISVLKDLMNLQVLVLGDNQISDINALKGMANLEYLDLSGNQIRDISVLKDLTNLEYLYLYGNSITDYSPVEFVPNLNK